MRIHVALCSCAIESAPTLVRSHRTRAVQPRVLAPRACSTATVMIAEQTRVGTSHARAGTSLAADWRRVVYCRVQTEPPGGGGGTGTNASLSLSRLAPPGRRACRGCGAHSLGTIGFLEICMW